MKTTNRFALTFGFLALASFCVMPARAADETGSRCMACVLKVQGVEAVLPLDFDLVKALLAADSVAGRASAIALGIDPDRRGDLYHVAPLPCDEPETVLLTLQVDLPLTIEGDASQFGRALIENLHVTLTQAYEQSLERWQERLAESRTQMQSAQSRFDEVLRQALPDPQGELRLNPIDKKIYGQLREMVDLSALHPEMPFGEAIEVLSRSVTPPLNIVVYWNDLADNADITPDSPIGMTGPRAVPLETALRTLINAAAGGFAELDFRVDRGIVTVATVDSLPAKEMETRVHRIPAAIAAMGQPDRLVQVIMEAVDPDSWYVLSEEGEGAVTLIGQTELAISQRPQTHRQIDLLLRQMAMACSATTLPIPMSREAIREHMELLLSYRRQLQSECDRYDERQEKLKMAEQIGEDSWRSIDTNLRKIAGELATLKGEIEDKKPIEKIAQSIDELIDKTEATIQTSSRQISRFDPWPVYDCIQPIEPWPQDRTYTSQASLVQTALETVTKRIEELDRMLAGPVVFDPQVERIQRAAAGLREAMARVDELERSLARGSKPSVTILGGID